MLIYSTLRHSAYPWLAHNTCPTTPSPSLQALTSSWRTLLGAHVSPRCAALLTPFHTQNLSAHFAFKVGAWVGERKREGAGKETVCVRRLHSQINAFERITHTPCEPQTEPQNMRRIARHTLLNWRSRKQFDYSDSEAQAATERERESEARRVINCWTS